MTSIHNLIFGIPKLTHSPPNWSTWRKDVEVILESEDLFSMVDGSATSPADPTQQALWQKWDKHMYAIIYLLVSSDKHHVIMQALLRSNTWPLLKAEFEKDVALDRLSLCSKFYNIVHDSSKPVTEFINTIQSISHQLAAIQHPFHDTEITNISSLPPWNIFFCLLSSHHMQRGANTNRDHHCH